MVECFLSLVCPELKFNNEVNLRGGLGGGSREGLLNYRTNALLSACVYMTVKWYYNVSVVAIIIAVVRVMLQSGCIYMMTSEAAIQSLVKSPTHAG